MSTATTEGPEWSAHAALWAEYWGHFAAPTWPVIADATGLAAGVRMLDVGCGSGEFCRFAADQGAEVSGLDAAEGMIAIARDLVPRADLRVGLIQSLPWPDYRFENTFPLPDRARVSARTPVTGFRPARPAATTVYKPVKEDAGGNAMRLARVACVAVATLALGAGSARAQLPWPGTGFEHLPPDPTVPYLPAVGPLLCPGGEPECVTELAATLQARTDALGCDHDAVFTDAYLTITQALGDATGTPGFFDRPDRVRHEARTYAQEYLDQYDRWHAGELAAASPAWQIAFREARSQSVTAMGDVMLALNAHIRRDNPIRAVEQTEGVLRAPGLMPEASGKPDHERVDTVLANSMDRMLTQLASRYDPTVDDKPPLFGTVIDSRGLYEIIAAWREESWRNAEQLRHARALGGVDGPLYKAKLAEIEASAKAGAVAILEATRATPEQNRARNGYCRRRLGL